MSYLEHSRRLFPQVFPLAVFVDGAEGGQGSQLFVDRGQVAVARGHNPNGPVQELGQVRFYNLCKDLRNILNYVPANLDEPDLCCQIVASLDMRLAQVLGLGESG